MLRSLQTQVALGAWWISYTGENRLFFEISRRPGLELQGLFAPILIGCGAMAVEAVPAAVGEPDNSSKHDERRHKQYQDSTSQGFNSRLLRRFRARVAHRATLRVGEGRSRESNGGDHELRQTAKEIGK